MHKRVFVIHGWDGYPEEGWFPWLKKELEAKGYIASIPAMPDPKAPTINAWVSTLRNIVGDVDENTYFVGHSIGCQTILRYLEGLPENIHVGGVVLVAGWMHLTPQATPDATSKLIAKPWMESSIDWDKVKKHTNNFVAVFSDDDPMVTLSEKEIFAEKLEAKIIVLANKRHFSGDDGIHELPVVVEQL